MKIGTTVKQDNKRRDMWNGLLDWDCVLVFSLVGWGGTEVPAALGGCVQYRGHLRGGMINRVIPYTVQRLG
jgi:hypothetical protein